MGQRDSCSLIKDLLPLYYDNATSKESNRIIKLHIKECQDCRNFLDSIKEEEIHLLENNSETLEYTKIARKIKRKKIITTIGIICFLLCTFIVSSKTFRTAFITGNSMSPTILNGEKYLINQFVYKLSSPKHFDIIVYQYNGGYYISRIIALPNETVEIDQGTIYINGKAIEHFSLSKTISIPEFIVKDNNYFILQDNIKEIENILHLIGKSTIVGKVVIIK